MPLGKDQTAYKRTETLFAKSQSNLPDELTMASSAPRKKPKKYKKHKKQSQLNTLEQSSQQSQKITSQVGKIKLNTVISLLEDDDSGDEKDYEDFCELEETEIEQTHVATKNQKKKQKKKKQQKKAILPEPTTTVALRQGAKGRAKGSEKVPRCIPSDTDDEESLDGDRQTVHDRSSKTGETEEALELLKIALEYLEGIGNTRFIRAWLQDRRFSGGNSSFKFRFVCARLQHLLTPKVLPTESITYDDFRIYRVGHHGFEILERTALLQGTSSLFKKTLGLVRLKGETQLLKAAISGWEQGTKTHPLLLNSSRQTGTALKFAECFGYEFLEKPGLEDQHRVLRGSFHASHAECQLIMFLCGKLLLETRKMDTTRVDLYDRLRELRPHPQAEILLSDDACSECIRFRDKVEEVTGIHFEFRPQINVGTIIKDCLNNAGERGYPLQASDYEIADEISSISTAITKSSVAITQTKTISKGKEASQKLTRFETMELSTKKRKRARGYEEEPTDFEWQPTSSKARDVQIPNSPPTSLRRRPTRASQMLLTPPETPTSSKVVVEIPSTPPTPKSPCVIARAKKREKKENQNAAAAFARLVKNFDASLAQNLPLR